MDNFINKRFVCGEVTVFLSIVLILILSLVGTLLESARIDVAKENASRLLDNSMNYVFTQYCRPLWEDYHIFFLEGESSNEFMQNKIISMLEECENISLKTSDEEKPSFGLDIIGLQRLETKIGDVVYANDRDGEIFGKEVTEYMKYRLSKENVTDQKQMLQDISTMNSTMQVVYEQLKTEQQLGKCNQLMLQIIGNIDGIAIGKNGVCRSWRGKIRTKPVFIKQFCPYTPTKDLIRISNDEIWKTLASHYINPITILESMEEELHYIDEQRKNREEKNESEKEQKSPVFLMPHNSKQKKLVKWVKELIHTIDETERLCVSLEKEENKNAEVINQWKDNYEQKKEELPYEIQTYMKNEMKLLNQEGEQVTDTMNMRNSINNIKPYLEENKKILYQVQKISNVTWGEEEQEIRRNLTLIKEIKSIIKSYHVKELAFDYQSFTKEKGKNPINCVPHDIKRGILPYVIEDTKIISKKVKQVEECQQPQLINFDKFADTERANAFNQTFEGNRWLKQATEEKVDSICLSKYIKTHFKKFNQSYRKEKRKKLLVKSDEILPIEEKEEENFKIKNTILDYEQEYIIEGNKSDRNNLEAIIIRLLLIRSAFNYFYLVTDKQAVEKAYVTAQGIVGFTCLEPLVLLTKQLILLVWGLEEAIIDVGGMLAGAQIALWKTKDSFLIQYEDLLRFSKKFVHQKIREIPENKKSVLSSYESYLSLFLNLTKHKARLERTMNEIEDNMCCRYETDFKFSSCIYGFKTEEEFYLPPKFLQLPFVCTITNGDDSGWLIKASKIQCY